jgi:hypothetical protein
MLHPRTCQQQQQQQQQLRHSIGTSSSTVSETVVLTPHSCDSAQICRIPLNLSSLQTRAGIPTFWFSRSNVITFYAHRWPLLLLP